MPTAIDPELLVRIQALFNALGDGQPNNLSGVYADDVEFIDPAHRVVGRAQLEASFDRLDRNVRSLRFDFDPAFGSDADLALPWTMHLELKRPRRTIVLPGISHLRIEDGLVVFHRDHFDLGAMLYEHVPVLGSLVRIVKRALQTQ